MPPTVVTETSVTETASREVTDVGVKDLCTLWVRAILQRDRAHDSGNSDVTSKECQKNSFLPAFVALFNRPPAGAYVRISSTDLSCRLKVKLALHSERFYSNAGWLSTE